MLHDEAGKVALFLQLFPYTFWLKSVVRNKTTKNSFAALNKQSTIQGRNYQRIDGGVNSSTEFTSVQYKVEYTQTHTHKGKGKKF